MNLIKRDNQRGFHDSLKKKFYPIISETDNFKDISNVIQDDDIIAIQKEDDITAIALHPEFVTRLRTLQTLQQQKGGKKTSPQYITYNKKKYRVKMGSRGGKHIIVDGKKIYIK